MRRLAAFQDSTTISGIENVLTDHFFTHYDCTEGKWVREINWDVRKLFNCAFMSSEKKTEPSGNFTLNRLLPFERVLQCLNSTWHGQDQTIMALSFNLSANHIKMISILLLKITSQ